MTWSDDVPKRPRASAARPGRQSGRGGKPRRGQQGLFPFNIMEKELCSTGLVLEIFLRLGYYSLVIDINNR
jgi:hypothetical protein